MQSLFANKKFAILGLGRSGISTAIALKEGGADIIAWDDSEQGRKRAEELGFELAPMTFKILKNVDTLVVSPGIPLTFPEPHPAIKHAQQLKLKIIGDLDIFYQLYPNAKFIGITGTNGKSTTTTLIGHILSEAGKNILVGGNIGVPVLELKPTSKDPICILEVSSYQLDINPSISFDIALLLNITPDHLDRHGTFENYVATKKKIFRRRDSNSMGFIGIDDPSCQMIYRDRKDQLTPISIEQELLDDGFCSQNGTLIDYGEEIMDLKQLPHLVGPHNWQNAVAAYAITQACGVEVATILEGLHSFQGLAHRQEVVRKIANTIYINDSKATNSHAAAKVLSCYENIYWILGGRPKQDGLSATMQYFSKIKHAYLIGEAAEQFAKQLDGKIPYTMSHTLDKAVEAAHTDCFRANHDASAVILSPACASWDQFPNFEVRGDAFRKQVMQLKGVK
jgi:UDP-N-acetylmuramoylalanine--D-glutamate ligase